MNYRHIYHAGNFADVFKHILLLDLMRALQIKSTPIFYLDTHAGISNYDLYDELAQKTQEFTHGILKVWSAHHIKSNKNDILHPLPQNILEYIHIIDHWNHNQGSSTLKFYPGSPRLIRHILRPQDRMVLSELHIQDIAKLREEFHRDTTVGIHLIDGYQALKAFLPPKENRGLVFIDPPFEKSDEFQQLIQQIKFAYNRWPNGVYAIWYPIKEPGLVHDFYQQLKKSKIKNILQCEFYLSGVSNKLNACGMVVINPPWQWEQQAKNTLICLSTLLTHSSNNYLIKSIASE